MDAAQKFTLTVAPAAPAVNRGTTRTAPAIISIDSYTCTSGIGGAFTVTTSGNSTPTIIETVLLPSGVTFVDNGDGTATLSVDALAASGSYSLNFTASNGTGTDAAQNFTLTISQGTYAPSITSSNSYTCTAGTGGIFTVTTSGNPTPAVTETAALPSGVTFVDNGDGTATLTVDALASSDSYPLSFTASNGIGSDDVQSFTLTVNQAPVAPSITSSNSYTCTAGIGGSFTVTTGGNPTPAVTETAALPDGVTFVDNGDGTATLTVDALAASGSYPLSFTASNGIGSDDVQSFTLTVNQAPAITSADRTTFAIGSSGSFTFTATGYPAPRFTVTGGIMPSGITLNAATGELSGTPAAGTASFRMLRITASNGVDPDASQIFTLTINPADAAPVITSGSGTTFMVGSSGSFTFTALGYPAPSFSTVSTLPSGVTLNATSGELSGTPAAGTGGTYPITIIASNGVSPNDTQSFTLAVYQAPAITSSASTTFTVGTSGSFTVTSTGHPARTYSETGTLPSGVTLNSATGALSGTPAAGTVGTYPITISASNGVSPDATQSFTLTIASAAPTVVSALPTDETHIAMTMSSALTGTSGDPAAFTISGVASAPSVTAVAVSGTSVTLTLSKAMSGLDNNVAIKYAKTGTKDLTNGTPVANFSGQPVAPSAFIVWAFSTGETTIVINMSKNLTAGTGTPAAFTVTGAASNPTVTNVQIISNNITITLNRALAVTDNPKISYIATGTNNLMSGGYPVPNFSGKSVDVSSINQ